MARLRGGLVFAMLILVLQLAIVVQHASAQTYSVTNMVPNTPGGIRFDQVLGAADMRTVLENAANYCRRKAFSLSPPKNIGTVYLLVEAFDGVAFASGSTIHLSAGYIQNYMPGDSTALRREITGVLYHESAHVWQNGDKGDGSVYFGGVVEGIADFVRLRSGYRAAHWTRQRGGSWWSGYETTAFFLDWIDLNRKKDFVNLLNQKMGQSQWSNDFFRQITGKGVDQLWAEYQASI